MFRITSKIQTGYVLACFTIVHSATVKLSRNLIICSYYCLRLFLFYWPTIHIFLIVKERLDYLEDGKNIFKLRLRLCSSLYPINERIRDFFLEYDRHTLRTSPPWGSELLEVLFHSYKNSTLHHKHPCALWFFFFTQPFHIIPFNNSW